MRLVVALGLAAIFWLSQAQAQSDNGNAIAIPPAPAIVPSPPSAPVAPTAPVAPAPPGLVETPLPPPTALDNADTGTDNTTANGTANNSGNASPPNTAVPPPATTTATSAPAPVQPPAVPSEWVSGKTAKIRVLDKVDGSIADLTIPVGGQSVSGDLLVSVLACDLHPTGQLPDDAIFVSIQPSSDPSAPQIYRGWMVRSVPAAAVVGDASETFRVVSCS